MLQIYAAKLDFKVSITNVKALKIDSSIFKIFKIVLANFWVNYNLDRN